VKLLIINYLFPPAGGIAVQRALSLAKYLPQFGFEVHVLSAGNAAAPLHDPQLLKHVPPSGNHSSFVHPRAAVRGPAEVVGIDFAAGKAWCAKGSGRQHSTGFEVASGGHGQESSGARSAGRLGTVCDPKGATDHSQARDRRGAGDGPAVFHTARQQPVETRVPSGQADHRFS
jgi:hypothetical protein